jgi:hypothetical protein
MNWLWHGKLKAWFDSHPLIFDWIKRGSWALLTAPALLAYWQRARLSALWRWLQTEMWMPVWGYVLWAAFSMMLACGLVVVVQRLRIARGAGKNRIRKSFRALEHLGVKWCWAYAGWDPHKITPHCSKCDAQVVPRVMYDGILFECGVCQHKASVPLERGELALQLQILINREIRKRGGDLSPVSTGRERYT